MAYTTIDDPSAHFQTALWTGDNSFPRTITNDGNSDLQPDWIWVKQRTTSTNHFLYDSSRTFNSNGELASNDGGAEGAFDNNLYGYISAATSDGFTVSSGTTNGDDFNQSTRQYVAWQWKANGGTTSSNTSGTITTTVQANTDAGFSIVTWTGNGSNATMGHGLGTTPQVIITKSRTTTNDWNVYHRDMHPTAPYNYLLYTHLTNAATAATGSWGTSLSDVNSSTFYMKYWINYSSASMLAYCFAEKQGFSKFGKYTGNGSSNGPFVYTGFRPAFVMLKVTNLNGWDWAIIDNKRTPSNGDGLSEWLWANLSGAEFTDGDSGINLEMDFLSNGFKCKTDRGEINGSGYEFIYMAFAENPFVTSTGIPTTAR